MEKLGLSWHVFVLWLAAYHRLRLAIGDMLLGEMCDGGSSLCPGSSCATLLMRFEPAFLVGLKSHAEDKVLNMLKVTKITLKCCMLMDKGIFSYQNL